MLTDYVLIHGGAVVARGAAADVVRAAQDAGCDVISGPVTVGYGNSRITIVYARERIRGSSRNLR